MSTIDNKKTKKEIPKDLLFIIENEKLKIENFSF